MTKDSLRILVVEDDDNDSMFIRRALSKLVSNIAVHCVRDGKEALESMAEPGRSLPSLILSDIKMPRMDGFELLACVRAHPALSHLPFAFLSSSSQAADRKRATGLCANQFFVKPANAKYYGELASSLRDLAEAEPLAAAN